jgi:cytochrome c oxidase subunit IV
VLEQGRSLDKRQADYEKSSMKMPSADDVKINLNQNLWALLLSLGALGAADYFKLSALFRWLSLILAIGMTASMAFTVTFYTIHYCKRKKKEWQ